MKTRNTRYPLIKTPCDYCGNPLLITSWERPVFCHDDCADSWLAELRATDSEPSYPEQTPPNPSE